MASNRAKQILVNVRVLTQLKEKVDEIENLLETLEIEHDRELMTEIAEARSEFAKGKRRVFSKEELIAHLKSTG